MDLTQQLLLLKLLRKDQSVQNHGEIDQPESGLMVLDSQMIQTKELLKQVKRNKNRIEQSDLYLKHTRKNKAMKLL